VLRSSLLVENEFDSVTWATGLVWFLRHGTGTELSAAEGDQWCAASSGRGTGLGPGYRVMCRVSAWVRHRVGSVGPGWAAGSRPRNGRKTGPIGN
jgi:hypothetical protein